VFGCGLMREVFYKEDPTWFFEDNEIIKTQKPPEYFILEQRVRHDLTPDIHCVFRTRHVNGNEEQLRWQSATHREALQWYRQLRREITTQGFTYVVNSDNL
jgi:hypothetical protein